MANVGVHGHSATLHLKRLWTRDVTITTGLVYTSTIPQLLRLITDGRLGPTRLVTHRFEIADTMQAYDVFADASNTDALKVVLTGNTVTSQRSEETAAAVGRNGGSAWLTQRRHRTGASRRNQG